MHKVHSLSLSLECFQIDDFLSLNLCNVLLFFSGKESQVKTYFSIIRQLIEHLLRECEVQ